MEVNDLSWLEIDAAAIFHNIEAIKSRLSPDCKLAPVLKANAYGHGYFEVGKLLDNKGFPFLAVHNLAEAVLLRDGGIKNDILIMGYVPLADLPEVVEREFDFVVYNLDSLRRLAEIADGERPARCHLKVETGTQRQGIRPENLAEFLEVFGREPGLQLRGVSSHFANIEDTTDHSYAQMQLQRFLEIKQVFDNAEVKVPYFHMASSAAALLFPSTHFDLARAGIAMYGLWPSKETYLSYRLAGQENQILRPALSWKTMIAQIKTVLKGEFIGYGTSYRATADTKLAVVPIGYYDGYNRLLGNRGYCLVGGMRAPIRGRICMNMFMIDVTDIPEAKLESEVTLIGSSGDETLKAEQLAEWSNTINYEIVSRIGVHLRRRVINQ
jgi:alanine racemase